jgi:methionyl-tRNA formyltransferase
MLAFAGTSPFGAAILDGLLDGCATHAGRDVALVISQPDRPAGRGRKVTSPAVAQRARERGLRLVQPERTHDPQMLDLYTELGIRTMVVAAFGQMIREPLLTDFLMINVHGSLLPEYRGAAPVERAIIDGCTQTGVGIMRMEAGLDTGPVTREARVPITPQMDAGALYDALAAAAIPILHSALDDADAGTITWTAQDDTRATYAHKITAADRLLNPALDTLALERHIRGLSPHIGAYLELNDGRLGVWRACVADDVPAEAQLAQPGMLWHDSQRLLLRCGDGVLDLLDVQPQGKRRLAAADWLRGLRVSLGHARIPEHEQVDA